MQLMNESVTAIPLPIPMSAVVSLQRKRARLDKVLDAIAALGEGAGSLGCPSPRPCRRCASSFLHLHNALQESASQH